MSLYLVVETFTFNRSGIIPGSRSSLAVGERTLARLSVKQAHKRRDKGRRPRKSRVIVGRARVVCLSLSLFMECDLHAEANWVQVVVLDEETAVHKVSFPSSSPVSLSLSPLTLVVRAQLLSSPESLSFSSCRRRRRSYHCTYASGG